MARDPCCIFSHAVPSIEKELTRGRGRAGGDAVRVHLQKLIDSMPEGATS